MICQLEWYTSDRLRIQLMGQLLGTRTHFHPEGKLEDWLLPKSIHLLLGCLFLKYFTKSCENCLKCVHYYYMFSNHEKLQI